VSEIEDAVGRAVVAKQERQATVTDVADRLASKRAEVLTRQRNVMAMRVLQEHPGWGIYADALQTQQIVHAQSRDDFSSVINGFGTGKTTQVVPTPEVDEAGNVTLVGRPTIGSQPVAVDGQTFAMRQAYLSGVVQGIGIALKLPELLDQAYTDQQRDVEQPSEAARERNEVGLDPIAGGAK